MRRNKGGAAEVNGQWQRVKPRPWVPGPLQAYQCKNAECSHKHLQFMQTQFHLEVHHDVDGGRTKAISLD